MKIESAPSINVFHIALRVFGTRPLAEFLRSYLHFRSGLNHKLVVLLKGFQHYADASEFLALLTGIDHEAIFVADVGFDIGAYVEATSRCKADYYVFFNSKTVLLTEDWLAKLFASAERPEVGLAGATGSWESLYTDHLNHRFDSRGFSFGFRSMMRRSVINRIRHLYYYPEFPNHHLRTNAFMVRRETWDRIRVKKIKTRLDTSRFENGRIGLTRQILLLNLAVLVVGKDGRAFTPALWPDSGTFWQQEQANLLVSDNQTQMYSQADPTARADMSRRAWGR